MPRHDQYGTHDEFGRGPRRSDAAREAREDVRDPRGRTPNYGSGRERNARKTGDRSGERAAFEGRDYERESYGGGYGVQRRTRDVPAAGRKGEWMQEGRRPEGEYRGQEGGSGMDGLASERAFGSDSNNQMSQMDRTRSAGRNAEGNGRWDDREGSARPRSPRRR